MTASRMIVWRHGRTEWNATGLMQGQEDIPLDELGQLQAKTAARLIAGYRPSALYASDLSRTRQTAEALVEVTGLEITFEPRLREIHVGEWAGLTHDQLAEIDAEAVARIKAGEDVRRSATGEDHREVAERVVEAFTEISEAEPDGAVVVLAMHGLAARLGIAAFLGLPEEHWNILTGMDNCAWAILDRRTLGWRLTGYNLTGLTDIPDPVAPLDPKS